MYTTRGQLMVELAEKKLFEQSRQRALARVKQWVSDVNVAVTTESEEGDTACLSEISTNSNQMHANSIVMHADENEVIPSSVIDSSCGSLIIPYISRAIGIGIAGDTGVEKQLARRQLSKETADSALAIDGLHIPAADK